MREDWLYPITIVNTASGVVATQGRETSKNILLNGKPFVEGFMGVALEEAYAEENGEVQIVIASGDADMDFKPSAPAGNFIIDFGVSPPFVSRVSLPIGRNWFDMGYPYCVYKDCFSSSDLGIKINKREAGIYEFVGAGRGDNTKEVTYRYNRKTRTVTKM